MIQTVRSHKSFDRNRDFSFWKNSEPILRSTI